ncbi:MAG: diadenylate cyclase [Proteobacteria bacterium]|nr:diadenylate cyclase [Pseudomonadota bacterium]
MALDSPYLLAEICSDERDVNLATLKNTIMLAIEIAREGREGRKVGTIFVVSDTDKVLERSKCMILDPLKGYPDKQKLITDSEVRETIKELAQLDGAYLVPEEGVFVSACRYLNASSGNIELPLGLGSRHMAAASISKKTNAVVVVVSESSIVRVFDDGLLISEIIPELWLLSNYSLHLSGPVSSRTEKDVTVVSTKDELPPEK